MVDVNQVVDMVARGATQEELRKLDISEYSSTDLQRLLKSLIDHKALLLRLEFSYQVISNLIKTSGFSLHNLEQFAGVFTNSGRIDLLICLFEQMEQVQNTDATFHFNFAYYCKLANLPELALKQLKCSIDLGLPGQEEAYLNLANIYSEFFADSKTAMAYLDKSLQINPNYLAAQINRGNLYEGMGDKAKAIDSFTEVWSKDQRQFYALSRLIQLTDDQKNWIKTAETLLGDASMDIQSQLDLELGLALTLDKSKQYQRAQNYLISANNKIANHYPPFDLARFETLITDLKQISNPVPQDDVEGDAAPCLFICGMHRSGSTLLEQVLSTHKDIEGLGELSFFPNLFGNSPVIFSQRVKVDELEFSKCIPMLRTQHRTLLNSIAARFDGNYLIDKRPDNLFYLPLIKMMYPQAKVIITKRDMKDIAVSLLFQQLGPAFNYANRVEDILAIEALVEELIQHYQAVYSGDVLIVEYEKVVKEFKPTITRVLEFCNLEWDERLINFHKREKLVMTASMSQIRSPLYASSIGRWENYKTLFDQ